MSTRNAEDPREGALVLIVRRTIDAPPICSSGPGPNLSSC